MHERDVAVRRWAFTTFQGSQNMPSPLLTRMHLSLLFVSLFVYTTFSMLVFDRRTHGCNWQGFIAQGRVLGYLAHVKTLFVSDS
jgi:O-antigen ligase